MFFAVLSSVGGIKVDHPGMSTGKQARISQSLMLAAYYPSLWDMDIFLWWFFVFIGGIMFLLLFFILILIWHCYLLFNLCLISKLWHFSLHVRPDYIHWKKREMIKREEIVVTRVKIRIYTYCSLYLLCFSLPLCL